MSSTLWTTIGKAFRRTALPLLSYYALTLAVPLANGAALSDTAFVRHAVAVFVVPPAAIMLACAVHSTLRARHQKRQANPARTGATATIPSLPSTPKSMRTSAKALTR